MSNCNANWYISMVMMGTSPSAFHHSSSFQSSSYLPKMEANILRDFQCCGTRHATMHDFVSHVEECHNDQSKEIQERMSISGQSGQNFGRQTGESSRPIQSFPNSQIPRSSVSQSGSGFQSTTKSPLAPIQDIDTLDDMEMEDTPPTSLPMQSVNTGLAQGFR